MIVHHHIDSLLLSFQHRGFVFLFIQEKPQSLFECDSSLTKGVEEQGVLFQSSFPPAITGDRRTSSVLNYWVVG